MLASTKNAHPIGFLALLVLVNHLTIFLPMLAWSKNGFFIADRHQVALYRPLTDTIFSLSFLVLASIVHSLYKSRLQ